MHNLLKHTSLQASVRATAEELEAKHARATGRGAVRVDPVIIGDYVPPNAENEITMECFNLKHWQLVVHQDDSGCQPPFDLDGLREELKDAREKLYDCFRGCESQFCLDSCRDLHQQDVKEILDAYTRSSGTTPCVSILNWACTPLGFLPLGLMRDLCTTKACPCQG